MLKIALLGIAGTLLALQLKSLKSDYAIYLILGVSLVIFHGVADQLSLILSGLASLRSSLPIQGSYLQVLLKIVGITYVAELAADLCRDAGFQTVAGQIQVFGKLAVLSSGIPVLTALLETIRQFLGG